MGKNMTLTLLCAVVLALWTGIECYMDRDEAFLVETKKVIVAQGDTVWNIADQYYDFQDRYKTMDEFVYYLRKDNNLVGDNAKMFIKPGDVLLIKLNKRK